MNGLKKLIVATMALLLAAMPMGEASAKNKVNRNVAIGVGVGLGLAAAAIIASQGVKAETRRGPRVQRFIDDEPRFSCRELKWKCRNGRDWACDAYFRRCD